MTNNQAARHAREEAIRQEADEDVREARRDRDEALTMAERYAEAVRALCAEEPDLPDRVAGDTDLTAVLDELGLT